MREQFNFLSILFFCASSLAAVGQSNKETLAQMPDDTTKVLYLRTLIDSLRERSSGDALYYALEGKKLAEQLHYTKGLAYMLESIGWMHYRSTNFSKALEVTKEAIHAAKQVGESGIVARCLISIAAIHFEQKQFDLAIIHFRQAAIIGKKVKDAKTYGRSMNNIGFSYIQLGKLDSAYYYTKVSYQVANQPSEHYIKGFACRNFGEIATAKGDWYGAIKHYSEGIALANESTNNYLKISILYRLGAVYNNMLLPNKAIPIFEEAINLGNTFGYRDELERSLKLIADSYVQLDNFKQAFIYQREYLALHDSLVNLKKAEQLILAQTKFDSELKQAQIELLTKDAAMQQDDYDQQKILTYFFIGCVNLLVILMVVLWYNNRRIKAAKQVLEKRNNEIREQAAQLTQLNATKDKLFSIISHDLRSPLGGLKGLMELISRGGLTQEEFVSISQSLRRNIDSVYDDLDNLLHWAQTQLKGIRPSKERFLFKELIVEKLHLFEEVARAKNITLINTIDEDLTLFADRNQMGLVVRNLLANAVKFSTLQGRIEVKAEHADRTVKIIVRDTGVGMAPDELMKLFDANTHFSKRGTGNEKGIGLGLLLVKEFVESNGGTVSVLSEIGRGSSFIVHLRNQPMPVPKHALAE
jgi:two-component system, sensor histidine kinase and response regulator